MSLLLLCLFVSVFQTKQLTAHIFQSKGFREQINPVDVCHGTVAISEAKMFYLLSDLFILDSYRVSGLLLCSLPQGMDMFNMPYGCVTTVSTQRETG